MAQKEFTGRIVLKHDTSTNWSQAVNFIPKKGELILYTDLRKLKIGNGITTVSNLPFILADTDSDSVFIATVEETTYAEVTAALNLNKMVIAFDSDGFFPLVSISSGNYRFETVYANSSNRLQGGQYILDSTNTWTYNTLKVSYNDLLNRPDLDAKMNVADYDADGSVKTAGGIVEYVEANGGKIDTIEVNGVEQQIVDKTVDITVPTNVSDLTNDSGYQTASDVASAISGKADSADLEAHTSNSTIHVTTTDKSVWNAKQDAISDLNTIRSGAEAGSTAVQPGDLATVATSGSYNDLTNKPTIPSAVTESTVSGWGFTKNTGTVTTTGTMTANHVVVSNGSTVIKDSGYTIAKSVPSDAVFTDTTYESKSAVSGGTDVSLVTTGEKYNWNNKGTYSKPSGGIPKTDLASAVQTSLGKADSALQSFTETDPTVPSWAKQANKPTYTYTEVGADQSGAAATALSSAKSYTDTQIAALPSPMVFKGTLGTGGTITSLPTAAAANTGYTYKVITNGTYASQAAKVGDMFISTGSAWTHVPSGDEPSGTVTNIATGTGLTGGPISTSGTISLSSASTASLAKADSAVQPSDLATVATSGSYNDLTNKPNLDAKMNVADYDTNEIVKNAGGIVEYVEANGGKIDAIYLNGEEQIIVDKEVDLETVEVFTQNTAPDAPKEGDIWLDTSSTPTGFIPYGAVTIESITGLSDQLSSKIDISAQAPKTSSMTQEVGIDENGKLWISPSPLRYGFRRKKAESNPSARIEYLYDAVEMAPAYMDYANGEFVWGDWKAFVEQVARPVMLKADGTVGYELDHDDQTKKLDGTSSDIANTAYNGNAMVEFGKFKWVKRYEDATYEYVIFSNTKFDNEYHAYAHTGADGEVKNAFYLGMYTSQSINSVYRSFGANNSANRANADVSIAQSKANGNGFNIMDNMKWAYVLDLLVLIGKSDNLQATYGEGNSGIYGGSTPERIANGTLKDKGAFFGYNTTESAVKVLWLENFWGNLWQWMHGLICDNGTFKTKAHAPFCDTPVSAPDYSGYKNTAITASAGGYVKDAYCTDDDAFLPKTVGGGSASTYFCDYFYIKTSTLTFALVGGSSGYGVQCGRFVYLGVTASTGYATFGSRLSYTP